MPKTRIRPDGGVIMDVAQVAAMMGVGTRLIYNLAKNGGLPAFKFGESWRFSRLALEEWSRQQSLANLKDGKG